MTTSIGQHWTERALYPRNAQIPQSDNTTKPLKLFSDSFLDLANLPTASFKEWAIKTIESKDTNPALYTFANIVNLGATVVNFKLMEFAIPLDIIGLAIYFCICAVAPEEEFDLNKPMPFKDGLDVLLSIGSSFSNIVTDSGNRGERLLEFFGWDVNNKCFEDRVVNCIAGFGTLGSLGRKGGVLGTIGTVKAIPHITGLVKGIEIPKIGIPTGEVLVKKANALAYTFFRPIDTFLENNFTSPALPDTLPPRQPMEHPYFQDLYHQRYIRNREHLSLGTYKTLRDELRLFLDPNYTGAKPSGLFTALVDIDQAINEIEGIWRPLPLPDGERKVRFSLGYNNLELPQETNYPVEVFTRLHKEKLVGRMNIVLNAHGEVQHVVLKHNFWSPKVLVDPNNITSIRLRGESRTAHYNRAEQIQFIDKSTNRSGLDGMDQQVLVDYTDPRLTRFLRTHFNPILRDLEQGKINKAQASQRALAAVRTHVKYGDNYLDVKNQVYSLGHFVHRGVCNEQSQLLQLGMQYLGIDSKMEKGPFKGGRHAWVRGLDREIHNWVFDSTNFDQQRQYNDIPLLPGNPEHREYKNDRTPFAHDSSPTIMLPRGGGER